MNFSLIRASRALFKIIINSHMNGDEGRILFKAENKEHFRW
jgi:hypothetical protein